MLSKNKIDWFYFASKKSIAWTKGSAPGVTDYCWRCCFAIWLLGKVKSVVFCHSKSVNILFTVLLLTPTEYDRINSYLVTVQASDTYKKDKRTEERQALTLTPSISTGPCSLWTHDSSLMGVQPEKKLFWKLVKSFFFFLRKLTVVLSSTSSSSSSASSSTLGFLTSFRSDEAWPMSTISFSTYKHMSTCCCEVLFHCCTSDGQHVLKKNVTIILQYRCCS